MPFTPEHRGGAGPPLVLLHGFVDTWRTWELVLPALERRHEVLAPTLAGHAGGPEIQGELSDTTLADHVEAAMDAAAPNERCQRREQSDRENVPQRATLRVPRGCGLGPRMGLA